MKRALNWRERKEYHSNKFLLTKKNVAQLLYVLKKKKKKKKKKNLMALSKREWVVQLG